MVGIRVKISTCTVCPTNHQISSWNSELATGENQCHWCQDTEIPHNAWRVPHEVQRHETLVRISECQSHYWERNKKHLWIHKKKIPYSLLKYYLFDIILMFYSKIIPHCKWILQFDWLEPGHYVCTVYQQSLNRNLGSIRKSRFKVMLLLVLPLCYHLYSNSSLTRTLHFIECSSDIVFLHLPLKNVRCGNNAFYLKHVQR